MADLTKITNFEIFRWRAKTTEFVEAGAAIIKHDTALPDGIEGNFFVAMDDINGNPIEAYVQPNSATSTQLGTTGLPLLWQPATGTDITGDPANGGRIPAKKEMRTVVSKTLLLQTLQALEKQIGSSLKLNSPFDFLNEVGNQGISNLRTFVSEGVRDIAFPDPAGKTEYTGFLCLVAIEGYQYHNGTEWITLGASTSVISSWKSPPARVATTANVDIATELKVGDTVDNIVLAEGDTVLVWMNTLPKENGLYSVSGSNPATRRSDFNIASEATGAAVAVAEGDTYADQIFLCTSNNPTIGTDDVDFAKLETAPIASEAEAIAGLDNIKMMTPLRVKQQITSRVASTAEAQAASDDFKMMTPEKTKTTIKSISNDIWIPAGTFSLISAVYGMSLVGEYSAQIANINNTQSAGFSFRLPALFVGVSSVVLSYLENASGEGVGAFDVFANSANDGLNIHSASQDTASFVGLSGTANILRSKDISTAFDLSGGAGRVYNARIKCTANVIKILGARITFN